ncbi:MAG: hypothetical protein ABIE70_06515 [bacterium]
MKIGANPAADHPPPRDVSAEVNQEKGRHSTGLESEPPDVSVRSQLGRMADSLRLSGSGETRDTYTEQQVRHPEPRTASEIRPAREISRDAADRLNEIRRRIEANYYDQPEVKSRLADRLAEDFESPRK